MKTDHKWLEKWESKLVDKTILELGCGNGIDTLHLKAYSDSVTSCDLEPDHKNGDIVKIDHSKSLPFKPDTFDVIVASLTLHYFSWSTTQNVLGELSRVLTSSGFLICRLNSTNDFNYGASGFPQIEENFYRVNGNNKRFFTADDINALFTSPWRIENLKENSIDRYGNEKVVWEFGAARS